MLVTNWRIESDCKQAGLSSHLHSLMLVSKKYIWQTSLGTRESDFNMGSQTVRLCSKKISWAPKIITPLKSKVSRIWVQKLIFFGHVKGTSKGGCQGWRNAATAQPWTVSFLLLKLSQTAPECKTVLLNCTKKRYQITHCFYLRVWSRYACT